VDTAFSGQKTQGFYDHAASLRVVSQCIKPSAMNGVDIDSVKRVIQFPAMKILCCASAFFLNSLNFLSIFGEKGGAVESYSQK